MAGVQPSEIRLGVAVFGRVAGFPWWPAVVSKFQSTDEWTKDGKFWVIFFNDTNGAWLKSSEIRSFDAYNKDRCLEHNSNTTKFRRYHERVKVACNMAEKYVTNPKRIRVRVIGPRGSKATPVGDEEEVISISDADADADDPGAFSEGHESPSRRRRRSGKSGSKRSRAHLRHSRGRSDDEEISEDDVIHRDGQGRDDGGRSRRKRIRSSRYEDYIGPFEGRNSQKRKKSADANGKHSSDDIGRRERDPNPLSYTPPKPFREGKHTRSKKLKGTGDLSHGVRERQNPQPSRRSSRFAAQVQAEKGTGRGSAGKRMDRRANSMKVMSKRLAHEPMRPSSHSDDDKRPDAAVTREMYISELTNMASPKAIHRRGGERSIKMPSIRRSVRSRAGGSSQENTSNSEETDSEFEPERVRKVVNGSLEAAAEDLVEYAVRGGQSGKGKREEGILNMDSLALGGSELVCSVLNRLSDLERDVTALRKKSSLEEQATLGEDASAAGLKSAVEALASATAAFAKARDYDSLVISRSLDLLWVDGHFPLKGADGELLRTVARSLVMASCKRRHEQVSRERIGKKQRGQRDLGKGSASIIRQKADLRDVVAKSEQHGILGIPLRDQGQMGGSVGNEQSSSTEERNGIQTKLDSIHGNHTGVLETIKAEAQTEGQNGGLAGEEVEEEVLLEENAEPDDSEYIVDGQDHDDQDVDSPVKSTKLL